MGSRLRERREIGNIYEGKNRVEERERIGSDDEIKNEWKRHNREEREEYR